MLAPERALATITDFYLNSHDFNGTPTTALERLLNIEADANIQLLSELIEGELISLVFGDGHPNPHIRALPDEESEIQLTKLHGDMYNLACIYPTRKHLEKIVDRTQYHRKPFTLELALGVAQLEFAAFDMKVLETYRNDPRYAYSTNDINGYISVSDEYYESDKMPDSDQTILESFGFCYDESLNRAVAVFYRYLSRLTPEHQQIWKANELNGNYKLHPDYYRTSILGDFPERISMFDAFLREQEAVNGICEAIGRPLLFRQIFKENKRPKGFGFIIRPTSKELDDFVHLLDKLLSENINKDFFRGEIELESEEKRKDGKIIIRSKSTIRLLGEWLADNSQTDNRSAIDEMLTTMREIRTKRQKPAHTINDDRFEQEILSEQRNLMQRAYRVVKTIRLILALHPGADSYSIDRSLQNVGYLVILTWKDAIDVRLTLEDHPCSPSPAKSTTP